MALLGASEGTPTSASRAVLCGSPPWGRVKAWEARPALLEAYCKHPLAILGHAEVRGI